MSSEQPTRMTLRVNPCRARCRLGERGAGAVEFALIIPFILLVIVGIIEITNVYFMRNQLNEIARDATRRIAVGALEEAEVKAFVMKRLAQTTDVQPSINLSETETGDVVDVSLSLSVPFADVLLFDNLIDKIWSSAPKDLSVSATMMKH